VDAIRREAFHALGLRIEVSLVAPQSLPRFWLKAMHITDNGKKQSEPGIARIQNE